MQTIKVPYPSFLAPALVNGDLSGLDDSDLPLLDAVFRDIAPCSVVGCEPWGFGSILTPVRYTGELLEFTLIIEGDES